MFSKTCGIAVARRCSRHNIPRTALSEIFNRYAIGVRARADGAGVKQANVSSEAVRGIAAEFNSRIQEAAHASCEMAMMEFHAWSRSIRSRLARQCDSSQDVGTETDSLLGITSQLWKIVDVELANQ